MTKEERLKYQRERRKLNGNLYTKRYEKTEAGFLMRMYRNMKSRVTGVQSKKAHLYKGKDLLAKEDFYEWQGALLCLLCYLNSMSIRAIK